MSEAQVGMGWSQPSEHGRLEEVLLCPPENFRWLQTSAITKATLSSDAVFEPQTARAQHAQLRTALEEIGAICHVLEPDPDLPYQVFTRDSSVMTPFGAVVTQMHQEWRAGEHAPVTRFYTEHGHEIWRTITAGPLEGGDFMMVDESHALIGACEDRTTYEGALQLKHWLEAEGVETRVEPFPARFVHLDVICAIVAPGLAALCVDAASGGLARWLRGLGFELLEVSAGSAMSLGVNCLALGEDRVLSPAGAGELNDGLRAAGLEVLSPDVSMFTLGGGGAHCLTQALRRS